MKNPDAINLNEHLPDVRDSLTRTERVILYVLNETQQELGGRNVPTAMLYGRVLEHVNIREDELNEILSRLGGRGGNPKGAAGRPYLRAHPA